MNFTLSNIPTPQLETKKEVGERRVTPTGYETSVVYRDQPISKNNSEFLTEMNGWVFACVQAIADEIASANIRLYEQNKDGSVEEIMDDPILDSLYKVNNFTTQFDHFWLTSIYLELTGEAPWFVDKKGLTTNDGITSIYFLRPDKLNIIPDEKEVIKGYTYYIGNGKYVPLEKDEVVFLKMPNPTKPIRGRGPLEGGARTVDLDNFSEEWNKTFYFNSARPESILNIKTDNLDEEQLDRIKKSIKKQYQGTDKAHKLMVLFGDMSLEPFGLSQKDMDFHNQSSFTRDKIFSVFKVPKTIVAQTDGVNLANAKTAERVFAKYTIKPKLARIEQQLNEFYVPLFENSENKFLQFDNPVPEEIELKLKEYESGLKNGYMTINEVRSDKGLPPVTNGDSIYLPLNLMPIGEPEGKSASEPLKFEVDKSKFKEVKDMRKIRLLARNKNNRAERKIKEALKSYILKNYKHLKKAKGKKGEAINLTAEQERNFWHSKDAITTQYIPKVKKIVEKFFKDQEKRLMRKIGAKKEIEQLDIDKFLLDVKKEIKLMIKLTIPIFGEIFKNGGDITFDFLGVNMNTDITRPDVQAFLKSTTRLMATSVTEETNVIITRIVEQGIESGEGVTVIADNISNKFKEFTTARADRIARTETVRYNSSATEQSFIDSGVVKSKKWITESDPCQFCATMAGKTIELGGDYFKKGDTITGAKGETLQLNYTDTAYPPLHPNCYDSLTEVYTKDGFVPIKDVIKGEKIMTLNPKTKDIVWSNVIKTINYEVDEVYSLSNKQNSFDMMVSKSHPFFGYKRVDSGKNGRHLHPVTVNGIKELNSEFRFYNSSEWKGSNIDCKLGDYKVTESQFAKFMGWYLSEGSVTKRGDNWYQVSIAQQKYMDELIDDLSDMPFNISKGKVALTINDVSLGKQLIKYGKSFEKFVPDEIKKMKSRNIRIFLDRYCLGDGSRVKSKNFKNVNFSDSIYYFTSSKRMADDLGELIIKIGKSVSYRKQEPKKIKHKNGIYQNNHIVWIISELTSNYKMFSNLDINKISKKQFVYDVEVSKNNTILVRRNGKVVWGSNCRCDLVPVFKDSKSVISTLSKIHFNKVNAIALNTVEDNNEKLKNEIVKEFKEAINKEVGKVKEESKQELKSISDKITNIINYEE